jgi:membrane protein DedA with SNARE-associated domain
MTIGASIFVIVVGAILYFAADVHVAHISINTVGLILMIAGLAGLVLGLIQQAIWARRSRRTVAHEDRPGPRQPPYG